MTNNVLYIMFVLAFIIHDGEEIALVHKWLQAHGETLRKNHPRFGHMLNHLQRLNTKAFAIAVLEELILLIAVTVYAINGGKYAIELWSAVFMAFSIHLIIHIGQAVITRGYVPGLITSILLLPFSYFGMHSICNIFSIAHLCLLAATGILVIGTNLAFAHWMGVKLFGHE